MARLSEYTDEIGKAICKDIACGDTVEIACAKSDVGNRTFYTWLSENTELQQNYMRARETRADAHFESSAKLMEDLRNGVIQSDQARIMLDEIKWKCAKQSAKKYGDSQTIKGDKENPLQFVPIQIIDDVKAD
jgi:hypothetical protein